MRNRTIQYAINLESGLVISRVDDKIYHPVLDFAGMTPENSWEMNYFHEEMSIFTISGCWEYYKWTRKIPKEIKNFHRKYWGFKPLKG